MKANASLYNQRLLRGQAPSYERLQARFAEDGSSLDDAPLALHCGWGRLLIGHTYPDPAALANELLKEKPGERDIALYVAAPQQVLAQSPQQLFLDPSDTLRLWFSDYRPSQRVFRGFRIRRAQNQADWDAIVQDAQESLGSGDVTAIERVSASLTELGQQVSDLQQLCTGTP